MTLFLDERCVADLIDMKDALDAVEEAFRAAGNGSAFNVPRMRAPLADGTLRITAATLHYCGYYGVKVSSSTVFESSAGRVLNLYKDATGELCAVVQVFGLGALRTGAVSGVATRHLANEDATVLGVIGTGRQARTQVSAICRVRPIREIRVFSRAPEHRARFCAELAEDGLPAMAVGSAEEAVQNCDVVVTATTATAPVMLGRWLASGTHVNAVGANYEQRRELDTEVVTRATVIATDDRDQVRYEATDLVAPVTEGSLRWEQVRGLGEILAGTTPGRATPDDITLFKSLGVALGDVALAARAYETAIRRGVGQQLPDLSA